MLFFFESKVFENDSVLQVKSIWISWFLNSCLN